MKEVYATNNEVEIQMLVGLLESQGILAQVHADGCRSRTPCSCHNG